MSQRNIAVRPATPADVDAIHELIVGLATYEKAAHEVKANAAHLAAALFAEHPAVFAYVAEADPADPSDRADPPDRADPADPADSGADGGASSPESPKVVGFALWYLTYSTWEGKHGIWLEDLYVRPDVRGSGAGKALLKRLARDCVDRDYARLEWWVLNWNEPALQFYRHLGAEGMDEWTVHRVDGAALVNLAD